MTRLLTVAGVPCEWGRHTMPAVLERYHPDLGWLTCCQSHLTSTLNVPVIEVKPCPVCRRAVRVRIDGRWPRHRRPGVGLRQASWCTAGGLEAVPEPIGEAAPRAA
jgi:hypothetical protein